MRPEFAARPAPDPVLAASLVCNGGGARILTWNNVVVQSIDRADASWARAFGTILRKQLRTYPDGVVSLAVLHTGLKPASKDVRQEMAHMMTETGRVVHHMLVVEDVGLLAQLLVTVIRGVMLLGGKHVQYSLPTSRAEAVSRALPLVKGRPRSTTLEEELSTAVAFCCARD